VLKSHDQFTVDVVNLSSRDLSYLSRLMKKDVFTKQAASQPVLKRLVSANIVSDSPETIAPQPFIVREVPARIPGNSAPKNVRIAFLGLTENSPAAPRGFKITDPVEAAKRAVPEARKRADLVVVLLHAKADLAATVARAVPDIDVIISGAGDEITGLFIPPITLGRTFLVFTPYETRMVGELRFYHDPEGKLSSRARFISLDQVVPDDSAALQTAAAAREAEVAAVRSARTLLTEWLAKTSASGQSNPDEASNKAPHFVSSNACARCHNAQYIQWSNSAHALTSGKLLSRQSEFEAGCLSCHATGFAKAEMAKLQNVQCEQCHGPGSQHVAKPGKGYGRVTNVNALCVSCHTAQTDADFNFQTAWAKIKH
jgi:Cytochrome c554 and c-prime